jgi:hypothetical protein
MDDELIYKNAVGFDFEISSQWYAHECLGNGARHHGRFITELSGNWTWRTSLSFIEKAVKRRGYTASVYMQFFYPEGEGVVKDEWYTNEYFPIYIIDGKKCLCICSSDDEYIFQGVGDGRDGFDC